MARGVLHADDKLRNTKKSQRLGSKRKIEFFYFKDRQVSIGQRENRLV